MKEKDGSDKADAGIGRIMTDPVVDIFSSFRRSKVVVETGIQDAEVDRYCGILLYVVPIKYSGRM